MIVVLSHYYVLYLKLCVYFHTDNLQYAFVHNNPPNFEYIFKEYLQKHNIG